QEWFPKSQLSSYGGKYDEVDGTFNYILASEWVLGQKGLLSSSVSSALINTGKQPAPSKNQSIPSTNKERVSRLPYKDDEDQSAWDDYFDKLNKDREED